MTLHSPDEYELVCMQSSGAHSAGVTTDRTAANKANTQTNFCGIFGVWLESVQDQFRNFCDANMGSLLPFSLCRRLETLSVTGITPSSDYSHRRQIERAVIVALAITAVLNLKGKIMKTFVLVAILVFVVVGCGGGSSNSVTTPSPSPQQGAAQASISLHDMPPMGVTVLSFQATITGMTIQRGNVSILSPLTAL